MSVLRRTPSSGVSTPEARRWPLSQSCASIIGTTTVPNGVFPQGRRTRRRRQRTRATGHQLTGPALQKGIWGILGHEASLPTPTAAAVAIRPSSGRHPGASRQEAQPARVTAVEDHNLASKTTLTARCGICLLVATCTGKFLFVAFLWPSAGRFGRGHGGQFGIHSMKKADVRTTVPGVRHGPHRLDLQHRLHPREFSNHRITSVDYLLQLHDTRLTDTWCLVAHVNEGASTFSTVATYISCLFKIQYGPQAQPYLKSSRRLPAVPASQLSCYTR